MVLKSFCNECTKSDVRYQASPLDFNCWLIHLRAHRVQVVVASRPGYLVALIRFVEIRVRLKSSEAKPFVLLSIIARYTRQQRFCSSRRVSWYHHWFLWLLKLLETGYSALALSWWRLSCHLMLLKTTLRWYFAHRWLVKEECPLQPFVFWQVLSIQRFSGQLRLQL